MNVPEGKTLTIPHPEDEKVFVKAECEGAVLELQKADEGYRIELPAICDPIDTVIRLTVN